MVAKIFIDGEAGTTGLQIRERLAARRDIDLVSIDPAKRKDADERKRLLNAADIAILCLPDAASLEAVGMLEGDTRVIDASTAFRVADGWAYGFAEMTPDQRDQIANARFVANPGCYPQGLIAVIRPLIDAGLVPSDFPVTLNAISGYSGGGRGMIEDYEAAENPVDVPFWPYGLTLAHKHVPEMTRYSGLDHAPVFQPSVGKYAQGMIDVVPLQLWALPGTPSVRALHDCLSARYADETFVTVAPLEAVGKSDAVTPEVLNGTNSMRLHVFGNDESQQALLVAVYDNLGKGASGAAVQNMNIMLGVDEATSLTVGA